ncbi:hypothetical protein MNBD_GAMMA12-3987, partial [hydrothermal vent metagenome]
MTTLDKNLNKLMKHWRKWSDLFEDGLEDNDGSDASKAKRISKIINIEYSIYEAIDNICISENSPSDLLKKINFDTNDEKQVIYFHLILSITDNRIFDKEAILIDFIKNLLTNKPDAYCKPIQSALHFSELSTKSTVIDLMLNNNNSYCTELAFDAIKDAKLQKFESICFSAVEKLASKGFQESDKELFNPLLEAIIAIQAKSCIPPLERMLTNGGFRTYNSTWSKTLFSLVELDSQLGWNTFQVECSNRTISPSETYLLGKYGSKSTSKLIKDQFDLADNPDWQEEYICALGLLGDTSHLETIVSFIDPEDTELTNQCVSAFYTICGEGEETINIDYYDCEEDGCKKILMTWLDDNLSKFNSELRYFDGKPLSLLTLIDDLTDPNYGTRYVSIEKLNAYTNVSIPCDPNGFVTHMIASQKEWQEWFNNNREAFPAGHWYRSGVRLKLYIFVEKHVKKILATILLLLPLSISAAPKLMGKWKSSFKLTQKFFRENNTLYN